MFVGPVMVDWLAVSEQLDGVPAAGGVTGVQVKVEPTRLQLHRLLGSEIVKFPAWAGVINGVINAEPANIEATASARPTRTLSGTAPARNGIEDWATGVAALARAQRICLTNIEKPP